MILPPLALALAQALPVMSLCQKLVKCQKFNRQKNRQKFAMAFLQNYKALLCIPQEGALKSRRGPHTSVILGPRGPIFTVRLGGGGHLRGGTDFL